MKKTTHLCTTAHVRPIGDVITDLRAKIVGKLPGSPAMQAAWAALNECIEAIELGTAALAELDLPDYSRWSTHGEIRLASTTIRKMADAFKVPVMGRDKR